MGAGDGLDILEDILFYCTCQYLNPRSSIISSGYTLHMQPHNDLNLV